MKRAWAAVLLLLLAWCSSAPTQFYVLTATAGAGSRGGGFGSQPLIVGHVQLPGDLDRLAVVTRIGPNQLNVSNQDQWAGPFDEMIQRVLAADLAARLPPGSVLAPGDPVPAGGARTVVVNVRQFMGDSAGRLVLEADWSLLSPKTQKPVERRHELLTDNAGSGKTPEIVAAMSRLLGQLSDRIAGTVG